MNEYSFTATRQPLKTARANVLNLSSSPALPVVSSPVAAMRIASALQSDLFNSSTISTIAFDAAGKIQGFNVGAVRLLGYSNANLTHQLNLIDICEPQELVRRAMAQSVHFCVTETPGVASIFALNCLHQDGHRLPVIASVVALKIVEGAESTGFLLAAVPFVLLASLQQALKGFNGGATKLEDQYGLTVEWPSHVAPVTRSLNILKTTNHSPHRRAEAVARNYLSEASREDQIMSTDKAQQALYELRVHQTELEMLAEELECTKIELNAEIVERKKLEKVLRESELRYRTVADFTSNWEYWILSDGTLRYVSPSCEQVSGYSPAEFYADPNLLSRIVHPEDQQLHARHQHNVIETAIPDSLDFRIRTKGGSVRWIAHVCRPVFDSDGKPNGVRASNRDNTERKQMEEQVHQLAFYDPLTKLPNRRLLDDRLNQMMANSKRSGFYCAVMFLDLDNFKSINDKHGHEVGDLLLQEVATRMRDCVREIDTVARFGGDEFVVVLGELNGNKEAATKQTRTIAEKIQTSLSAPYSLKVLQGGGKDDLVVEHHCSASIDVVVFVNHEASQNEVMKWADATMYEAKKGGRNKILFYGEKGCD
ncbi:MAG: sensor domain-containing diguanylate cyclase [Rhodoferax sp.]|uniref:sensor domain-containing diguanylate cyclase n=1 Tax=Rhodoferax sp. TaxID=50421 RepID=UPI00301935E5